MATTEAPSTAGAPPGLTFPPAVFAKLSPHAYLLENLLGGSSGSTSAAVRSNGRGPSEARRAQVNATSPLSRTSYVACGGSALVRVGDSTAICGVRAETLSVERIPSYRAATTVSLDDGDGGMTRGRSSEAKRYDLLVPNVELATGCAPQFLPGQPPSTLAQALSTRVYSLLHSSGLVRPEALRIYGESVDDVGDESVAEDDDEMEIDDNSNNNAKQKRQVKAFWVLYIDVLFISYDGNPFDVAWLAVLAALRDTRLPAGAYWDADTERVVCPGGPQSANITVCTPGVLPVACTAVVFAESSAPGGRLGAAAASESSTSDSEDDEDSSRKAKSRGRNWLLVDPDRLEETLCSENVTAVVDLSSSRTSGKQEHDIKLLSLEKSGGTALGPEQLALFVRRAAQRWVEVEAALAARPTSR